MARRFSRFSDEAADSDSSGEINISPLIDIVFILLIFFIVTTVFVEETGLKIEKPRAVAQQDLEKNSVLIGISPEGAVYFGGREIGVNGVRSVVSRLMKQEEAPVIIQVDRRTATEVTVEVLDEAKLGGATQVFVSTVGGDR